MAYRAALDYLAAGLEVLPADPWDRHYDLVLGLGLERAEAAYLASDFDTMEAAAADILARAHTVLDTVKVYELRIARYNSEIRYPEAVAAGLEILARLGEPLPERPGTARVLVGLASTVRVIHGRQPADLLTLPRMTDARQLAVMRVLMDIASATYYVNANLFPLLVFRMVRLSVRHGNAPLSAFGYACYGLILCGVVNRVNSGYAFGRLAIDLLERFGARELEAKIAHLTNLFIRHWRDDLRDTLAPLLSGAQAGLETGDYEYSSYCRLFHCCHSLFSGEPLDTLEPVLRAHYDAVIAHPPGEDGRPFPAAVRHAPASQADRPR
jgi:predicted ATPase